MNMLQIISFDRTGDALLVGKDGNTPVVAMRPICENLGLTWGSQWNRLRRDPVLNSAVFMMKMVDGGGKTRDMVCLPIKLLNGWLFRIEVNRVKPHLRERIIAYQEECFDVLHQHFFGASLSGARRLQFSPAVEKIDDVLAFLHDHQLRVLAVLRVHANPISGQVMTNVYKIAEDSGISRANATRTICLLSALNVVDVRRGQGFWLRHNLVERAEVVV